MNRSASGIGPMRSFMPLLMLLMFLAAIPSAFTLSEPVHAAPKIANISMADRVEWDKNVCEGNGGKLTTSIGQMSATTTCAGGLNDGRTCKHTFSTQDCNKTLVRTPEPVAPGAGETADPGHNSRNQTTVTGENTMPSGGVAEDPTLGEEVTANVTATSDEQVLACESLGGIATVVTNGSIAASEVHCRGGVLDGMTCIVGHYDSSCTFFRVTTDPGVRDGIRAGSLADTLENVTGGGRIVVMNQSGDNLDNVNRQAAVCRALGGVSEPNYEISNEDANSFSEASCKGGLLDGLYCFNTPSSTVCIFMRAALPESTQVDPSAGNEVPVESAPLAPSPTAQPTEVVVANPTPTPTSEPTAMPTTEPTVAPTEATDPPVFPTPPTDDIAVPPGEAEDPVIEPTPTEVILY